MIDMNIFLLVLSVLGLVAGAILVRRNIKLKRDKKRNGYSFRSNSLGAFFSATVAVFMSIGVIYNLVAVMTLEQTTPYEKVVVQSVEITQLYDTMTVQGRFFLGTGTIDGKPAYACYIEEDGGYRLKHIDAKDAIVQYIEDGSTPRIETIKTQNCWTDGFVQAAWSTTPTKTIIYVPENSIRQYYLNSDAVD